MGWILALVAFLVAVLSGLGVGSAGLLVIYLTAVEQMPQLAAQGLNLLFFLFSSGAALTVHLLRTPLLFGCILVLLPGGIFGSFLGTWAAHLLPASLLRRLFGILLAASGALGLLRARKGVRAR
jgi:uncharacterized membrane protein YfcA